MQDPVFVHDAFAKIAKRYDLTNHVLSLGTDVLWRRKVAGIVTRFEPKTLLDVATGTGDLAAALADKCPGLAITGLDFSEQMLDIARTRKIPGLNLVHGDAMKMPFASGTFDAVTSAFGLRNLSSWGDAIWEMARVTRTGGHLIIFDFSLPQNVLMRGPYRFYLHRLIPRVAGWITGHREAYSYLAGSIETFPSGEAMCDLIKANGWVRPQAIPVSMGIATIYTAERP